MKFVMNECVMVNAFLWGCAIIAAGILLKGTEYAATMVIVLTTAAGGSVCYSGCRKKKSDE